MPLNSKVLEDFSSILQEFLLATNIAIGQKLFMTNVYLENLELGKLLLYEVSFQYLKR